MDLLSLSVFLFDIFLINIVYLFLTYEKDNQDISTFFM